MARQIKKRDGNEKFTAAERRQLVSLGNDPLGFAGETGGLTLEELLKIESGDFLFEQEDVCVEGEDIDSGEANDRYEQDWI